MRKLFFSTLVVIGASIGASAFAAGAVKKPSTNSLEAGKKSFEACIACHSLKPGEDGAGPSLHKLIGRSAGSAEGFRFSGPMKRSGVVWDQASLTEFLRNPQEKVPGNRMPFSGMTDEAELKALVGYLESAAK
jgi:cytochrome c